MAKKVIGSGGYEELLQSWVIYLKKSMSKENTTKALQRVKQFKRIAIIIEILMQYI